MKYGLICPPPDTADYLTMFDLGFHFVLAQYLNDPEYLAVYDYCGRRGHFIMLDNGAAELGEGISNEELAKAADLVHADEVVMPDVLDNAKSTLERTYHALQYFPIRQRAMCPQGATWEEWEYCATVLVDMGCKTICVAKRYEALPGGRAHALQIIENNRWHLNHTIHLLGCYRDPIKEITTARKRFDFIRSFDTAAPIAYAQADVRLVEGEDHHSLKWDAPFNRSIAYYNIKAILEACGGINAHNDQE